jgi:hypothetical protein
MKYKGITADNFADLIEDKDTRQIEADIIDFMISLNKRCYTLNSQQCYLNALIHFYSINDVIVRRKKIVPQRQQKAKIAAVQQEKSLTLTNR